jgi:hypothetical protein
LRKNSLVATVAFFMKTHLLSILPVLVSLFGSVMVAAAQPGSGTGIEGSISISPAQPGPTRQGVPDSRPLPKTSFVVKQGDRIVTSFETDDEGRFRVLLPPGHYTISKKDRKSTIGSFGPFEAEVTAGNMISVNWTCDSGIR